MRGRRCLAATLVLAFCSACAVGPNFVRPEVSSPEDYRGHVGPAEASSIADLPWWEVFEDPVLQDLIREALEANFELKTAVYRVEQARALLGVARSAFYPQIEYQGDAGRQRQPELLDRPSETFSYFYGAFAMAWELDVWGRIRRSSEAARESLLATDEFRRGVLLSLATGVAQSYLALLELDRELEISHATAKSFQETVDLFTRRYRGGAGRWHRGRRCGRR